MYCSYCMLKIWLLVLVSRVAQQWLIVDLHCSIESQSAVCEREAVLIVTSNLTERNRYGSHPYCVLQT